jgi:hypothetical protein
MLPRVCAPAQVLEVEVPRVAKEVPQLHEKAVGYVSQPKDSDVLTPVLWAARTQMPKQKSGQNFLSTVF